VPVLVNENVGMIITSSSNIPSLRYVTFLYYPWQS
jgi:hypothetical protein